MLNNILFARKALDCFLKEAAYKTRITHLYKSVSFLLKKVTTKICPIFMVHSVFLEKIKVF